MAGEVLGFLGLNDRGDKYLAAVSAGALVVGFVLGLLPLGAGARAAVVAAGPVAALVFFALRSPYGLDAAGWFVILAVGVLGWFVGVSLAGLIRCGFRRDM